MAEVRFLPPAAKYIKKIKDKALKARYKEAIDKIREDHTVGQEKLGDLSGIYSYDIYYNKTNYELAYRVEYVEDKVIVIIMAGTRENFYEQLKRYMKNQIKPQYPPLQIKAKMVGIIYGRTSVENTKVNMSL